MKNHQVKDWFKLLRPFYTRIGMRRFDYIIFIIFTNKCCVIKLLVFLFACFINHSFMDETVIL
uniref:Uncharacterized protein n=1 Tax=Meloidogyne enterolobii TaxID=390850 RepID=A0A6V7WDI8_MELEN|nr:unnamed protein product [Meloidogyne enterolobii]